MSLVSLLQEPLDEITLFADLILPVPMNRLYTYRVPREVSLDIKVGARVVVNFGASRVLTAIVARLHEEPPTDYKAKYILELLDTQPMVTRQQLELFRWISDYYICGIGEVMNVAIPSGLKITSQSKVQFNPDFDYPELLTPEEEWLLEEIKKVEMLTYEELGRLTERKNITPLVKSLVGKRAIILFEEIREKYQPKVISKVRLNPDLLDQEQLAAVLNSLERYPKQLDVVMRYISLVPVYNSPELNEKGIDKAILAKDPSLSLSALQTLIKKQIMELQEIVVSRFDSIPEEGLAEVNLSVSQQQALESIQDHFKTKPVVLLHGITGSGKTEIFIELVQQALAGGVQVLYLLPEIALTTQIVGRLKKVFGNTMGIYHSRFSDNERVEVWKGIVEGRFQFVVGVRSAALLPFDNLGLIIVDEEHESSYKQYDPAPRYNARDVAVILAHIHKGKALLGSATPSLESYYNAQTGLYGLVTLSERFGSARLPDFELINLKQERKQRTMREEFSSVMIQAIEHNLSVGEQTILFQNRRGYSPWLQCEDCDHIVECKNCAVSLTYHMRESELRCHYCGYKENVPSTCPSCSSTQVRTMGFGTEKIESQLQLIFPQARIQRMDLDTTRSKNSYASIIKDFEDKKIDILVGTQMVTKGLDFDNVSIVGIFDADRLINFPEFRATERSFQLLTQVSGRAGRRSATKGKVLIQSNNPQQEILHRIISNDYIGMYESEIKERSDFGYPPFTRLIKLTVKHTEYKVAYTAAQELVNKLIVQLGQSRVLGPEVPLVERVRNRFLFDILIKLEREKINFKAVKVMLREKVAEILTDKTKKNIQVVIDVDPF